MAIVNTTLRGANALIYGFKVSKQGDRKLDSASVDFTPYVGVNYGDELAIVKDVIDGAELLSLYHPFTRHLLDESGHRRHLSSIRNIPLANLLYDFQNLKPYRTYRSEQ